MMSKLIYYPLTLVFLVGVFFLVHAFDAPNGQIYYRDIAQDELSGTVLQDDTLAPNTRTDLFIQPAPKREVFWLVTTPAGDTVHFIESTQPYTFSQAGTYHVEAFHGLRKVGSSAVFIPEVAAVRIEIASSTIEVGGALVAFDKSTANADTKRWRLVKSGDDEAFISQEDKTEFSWSAHQKGAYTLYLEYLDGNGDLVFADSKEIEVFEKKAPVVRAPRTPSPKRELSAAELLAAKQERENRDKLKKERADEAERKRLEDKERARQEKDEKDRASMPSWYDHTSGAKFTAGPVVPEDRRLVTFKSGSAVFTIAAKEDMALVSLSFWGNHNTGNVTVEMECLTCLSQKKLRKISFLTAQGTNFANERILSTGKGFIKGHTYKVMVTMEKETELGFVKLGKTQWNDPYMDLKFETPETPVYGLKFEKR